MTIKHPPFEDVLAIVLIVIFQCHVSFQGCTYQQAQSKLKSETSIPFPTKKMWLVKKGICFIGFTPLKSNIGTKHDGLQHVSHFKYGYVAYLRKISGGYI